jgi:hypothetical protein
MRSAVVVALPPVFGHATYLRQGVEDVAVQHFRAVLPVEAFDVGILCRFAGLDEDELDRLPPRPGGERDTDEFRPVVEPQPARFAPAPRSAHRAPAPPAPPAGWCRSRCAGIRG